MRVTIPEIRKLKERKKFPNQDARELLKDSTLSPEQHSAIKILITLESFFSDKSIIRKTLENKLWKMGCRKENEMIQCWKDFGFVKEEETKLNFRTIQCSKCRKYISTWIRQRVCYTCQEEFCDECESKTPRGIPLQSDTESGQKYFDGIWVCEICFNKLKEYSRELPSEVILKKFPVTIFHYLSPLYLHFTREENIESFMNRQEFCTIHFSNGNLIPPIRVALEQDCHLTPEIKISSDIRISLMNAINSGYFGHPEMMIWVWESDEGRDFLLYPTEPNAEMKKYHKTKQVPACKNCNNMVLSHHKKDKICVYCNQKLSIVYRDNRYFQTPLAPKTKDSQCGSSDIYFKIGNSIFRHHIQLGPFLDEYQKFFPNKQLGPFKMSFRNGKVHFSMMTPEKLDHEILLPEDLIT